MRIKVKKSWTTNKVNNEIAYAKKNYRHVYLKRKGDGLYIQGDKLRRRK